MPCTSSRLRFVSVVLGLLGSALAHGGAQTFAAPTGTAPILGTPIAVPIPLPPHPRNGEETLMYAKVRNGVYSVDGLVAKLRLNYDVQGAAYMYMFVPGLGTAIISAAPDADVVTSKATVHEGELRFATVDHIFTLTGFSVVNGKGQIPEHLYVRFDRASWHLSRLPMLGYGKAAQAPYEWPGAGSTQVAEEEIEPTAPPVPVTLLPSQRAVRPALTPISNTPSDAPQDGVRSPSVP